MPSRQTDELTSYKNQTIIPDDIAGIGCAQVEGSTRGPTTVNQQTGASHHVRSG